MLELLWITSRQERNSIIEILTRFHNNSTAFLISRTIILVGAIVAETTFINTTISSAQNMEDFVSTKDVRWEQNPFGYSEFTDDVVEARFSGKYAQI